MLRLLAVRDQGVVELASNFEITQPAVTKHLNVLESAGLISRQRKGRYRMCRMEPLVVQHTAAWLNDLGEYWNSRFSAIDTLLKGEKENQ